MSKRRKPGDWVWLMPNSGCIGEPNRQGARIQPEVDPSPCLECDDNKCVKWSALRTDKGDKLCHIGECRMLDEPVCDALALLIWTHMAHPELRIGQLISDAFSMSGASKFFYMSDDELTTGLRRLYAECVSCGEQALVATMTTCGRCDKPVHRRTDEHPCERMHCETFRTVCNQCVEPEGEFVSRMKAEAVMPKVWFYVKHPTTIAWTQTTEEIYQSSSIKVKFTKTGNAVTMDSENLEKVEPGYLQGLLDILSKISY